MPTRWLDDEERRAWVRLAAVLQLLPGVLETQLQADAGLTHFEYRVLSMLSETEGRTLRMSVLAARTSSTLPRLSHVVHRLEVRGLLARSPSPQDRRATDARLTDEGMAVVVSAAPGHLEAVREHVVGALDRLQLDQLAAVCDAVLERVDPRGQVGQRHLDGERTAGRRGGTGTNS